MELREFLEHAGLSEKKIASATLVCKKGEIETVVRLVQPRTSMVVVRGCIPRRGRRFRLTVWQLQHRQLQAAPSDVHSQRAVRMPGRPASHVQDGQPGAGPRPAHILLSVA